MTYESLNLVGIAASVLLCGLIVIWQRRLMRRPGIETVQDTDLKRAFGHTIRWAVLGGVFFGIFGIACCWVALSFAESPLKFPPWIPPPAIFLPLVMGLYSVARASHPPIRVR